MYALRDISEAEVRVLSGPVGLEDLLRETVEGLSLTVCAVFTSFMCGWVTHLIKQGRTRVKDMGSLGCPDLCWALL